MTSKRAAGGDAVSEPGPSSGPAAQKRIVYRGGIPLKRFKGCRCISEAAVGESTRDGSETLSQEDRLDLNRSLLSCGNGAGTLDYSTVDDGFMKEVMAMAHD
ncbi:uncharacterized protein [Dermacentor andersoni]|uniref:uncharacterized protein n=1 Tax=Dermacentor andersoni TaxID=34620 RepID=UPI002416EA3E|nr:uncharacterized protein LOC129386269 [Dermacentor andersoni]